MGDEVRGEMYRCALLLGERSIGEVRWSQGEGRVTVWAECPYEKDYIYRVTLYGAGGVSLPLGVMAPEDGRFVVKKSLPAHKGELLLHWPGGSVRGEITRTLPGETRTPPLPFAFSSMTALPEDFGGRRDPLLCRCARQAASVRYLRHDGREYLVFPLETGREMPFTPFFCLVTPVRLDGASYGVLCLDREGDVCRFEPDK